MSYFMQVGNWIIDLSKVVAVKREQQGLMVWFVGQPDPVLFADDDGLEIWNRLTTLF